METSRCNVKEEERVKLYDNDDDENEDLEREGKRENECIG